MAPGSVATTIALLYAGARLVAPEHHWCWLKALKTRLQALGTPEDRFDRLVPAHRTLQLGTTLMEEAIAQPVTGKRERELEYRDGLIIAILSLWPLRRRSLATLTLDRDVEASGERLGVLLFMTWSARLLP